MKTNICIRNLLKFIWVLQRNSCETADSTDNCSKCFLGPSISFGPYNTRVITLYTKNGQLFEFPFYVNGQTNMSSYFRIQDIDDECCTLLILNNVNGQFLSTGQTIKVRLVCIGAVKCINDINIIL